MTTAEPICALARTEHGRTFLLKGPNILRLPARFRTRWNGIEQVAAVCFRVKRGGIEFLLVRTGSGRWTFPKGCAEPDLTRAQSAALEAFEEAGVHGRIEEVSFARYFYRKRRAVRSASVHEELIIHAHLCEVSSIGRPEESNRQPRWFSIEKAKRRLRERRAEFEGAELVRVIDLAVIRVQKLSARNSKSADGLQRVKFDAFDVAGVPGALQPAAVGRYISRNQSIDVDRCLKASFDRAPRLLTGKVLQLPAGKKRIP